MIRKQIRLHLVPPARSLQKVGSQYSAMLHWAPPRT